ASISTEECKAQTRSVEITLSQLQETTVPGKAACFTRPALFPRHTGYTSQYKVFIHQLPRYG
ncbi:hypothetical protein, partial [Salmonella enterica]|uniref:hypothetical protein n=1 Tax=Salmonella enterica TaxID=28901 RepID=UPI0020C24FA1